MTPGVRSALLAIHAQQGKPAAGWVFPSESKAGHLEQGSAKNQHKAALQSINEAGSKTKKSKARQKKPSKLEPFPPYTLRHSAITNLSRFTDDFTLKTLAGHSSISITQLYTHPQQKRMIDAVAKLAESQKVGTEGGHSQKRQKKAAS
jgi:site-specific recombinase XerD